MTQGLVAGNLAHLGMKRLENNRKFLPLSATIGLFLIAYLFGAISYPGMRDGQAFLNLFNTTPFLLICVVGETFVIISGGIDLSVSGIVALTTVAAAALLQDGWNPWLVFPLMLLMGMGFGFVMGIFITYLKVQPFIATLAGMWLARGLCYIISDNEIRIYDPVYRLLSGTRILIPGLSDPGTKTGDYITILVAVAVGILAFGMFLAHFTRFGRTVYAMGGNNGANEQSARLMGLPVDRTKVLVYVFSGFCSALAGIAYSIYVGSGHGTHATGFELTVIAAVVIGGIALTGGEGYLFGALFGVLITALIQSLIQFNGELSSWWTSIVIGALLLLFIGVQSVLAAWNARAIGRARSGAIGAKKSSGGRARWTRRRTSYAVGAVLGTIVFITGSLGIIGSLSHGGGGGGGDGGGGACVRKPMRDDRLTVAMGEGAVVAFERNGGTACVDEVYAIFPDGRIVSDYGDKTVKSTITAAEVNTLVKDIDAYGWFTTKMYDTNHTPCGACYSYVLTVFYAGQTKTVKAVDGGTDAPPDYWLVTGKLSAILYPGH